MKGLLTLKELSTEQIQGIITYAEELKHECRVSYNNKKFATLFFENSTRTHYSFIMALKNLGIDVIRKVLLLLKEKLYMIQLKLLRQSELMV